MRSYVQITEEYPYTIIHTKKSRYVLDICLPDTTYVERRIHLLADVSRPYALYPLTKRITMLSQLVCIKGKKFIDSKGNITTWSPKKFYPVVCLPIQTSWLTSKGASVLTIKGLNTKFIVDDGSFKYAQILQIGRLNLLFDLCNEERPQTRRKV